MIRRLRQTLTLLSALLCLALLILWCRSHFTMDELDTAIAHDGYRFGNFQGRLFISIDRGVPPLLTRWTATPIVNTPHNLTVYISACLTASHEFHFAGFHIVRGMRDRGSFGTGSGTYPILPTNPACEITIPHWMPALAFALLPLAVTLQHLRRRARRQGLCPTCHYDLRAHLANPNPPTQNSEPRTQNSTLPPRCPECGTPIPANLHSTQDSSSATIPLTPSTLRNPP